MTRKLALLAVVAVVALFFVFDLQRFVSLQRFLQVRSDIEVWRDAHPATALLLYFGVYVFVAALSLPVSTVLTLAGGALFGWLATALTVSFAASIGATIAFLLARLLAGDWVQTRFAAQLATINAGMRAEGAFYLFALRLVPLVPFFIVNLVMGLTRMRTATFYAVTQLGMLPANFAYAYAGAQIGRMGEQMSGQIGNAAVTPLSPGLLTAFAILGLLPLAARRLLQYLRRRRTARGT